jgi:hypothetical protein
MSYNYTIRIEVPASQAEVAAKIGAALDPDSGGAASWNKTIIGYTEGEMPQPIYGDTIFVSTPCQQEFHDQVPVLLANPAMLHAIVANDFANRWPDEVPPTLAECESFCKSVIPEPT